MNSDDNAHDDDEQQEERDFVVLTSGKLPQLREQLEVLQGAGVAAQIVQPPDAAVNG